MPTFADHVIADFSLTLSSEQGDWVLGDIYKGCQTKKFDINSLMKGGAVEKEE